MVASLALVATVAAIGASGGRATRIVAARPMTLTSCASSPLSGPPSKALLSILAVLRRPATPADSFRPSPLLTRGVRIFVNYVRRARVVSGSTYYVYPVFATPCGVLSGQSGESMALTDVTHSCGTGTVAGLTAVQIRQGEALSYGGDCSRSLLLSQVSGIVPDGVAAVTLHYPAGRVGGYSHKMAPAANVTTRPVNNVIVVMVPRGGGNGRSWTTMTWRAANGTIIQTFGNP
jgi:hypothetical protein